MLSQREQYKLYQQERMNHEIFTGSQGDEHLDLNKRSKAEEKNFSVAGLLGADDGMGTKGKSLARAFAAGIAKKANQELEK